MQFYDINKLRNLFNYKNKQLLLKIIMLKQNMLKLFSSHIKQRREPFQSWKQREDLYNVMRISFEIRKFIIFIILR